jgi:hypothetical protein
MEERAGEIRREVIDCLSIWTRVPVSDVCGRPSARPLDLL